MPWKSNKVRCVNCGKEVESKHRHDFVVHECVVVDAIYDNNAGELVDRSFKVWFAVDGGLEYLRRVGGLDQYEELSIWDDGEQQTKIEHKEAYNESRSEAELAAERGYN